MINKLSQKINSSSLHVLETFKILLQGNYAMPDIVNKLNEIEPCKFNSSVVSKYINTCRYVGIDIPKINNNYIVAHVPFGLELSMVDVDIIQTMQAIVLKDMTTKNIFNFNSLITKLNKYSNKKIARIGKEEFKMSFELFERAVSQKRKVNLIFKTQQVLECIPLKITEINGKTFFNVYNKRIRSIDVNRISGVELTGQQYIEPMGGDMVAIFKLSGNLAKRYEARENERVELLPDGSIVVINTNENKEMLFSRLLRYENMCEILKPKAYRDEFIQIINDTLKNYGIG